MSRFSRFIKVVGEEKFNKVRNATILILGVGGVGGHVVESLARSGVGKLILVDYDTVDESNINRQIIALNSTIGRKKIEVFKERILDINPSCQVVLYDMFYEDKNKEVIFKEEIDYVVDACDTVASKKNIILECQKRNIPFISCMGTGNKLDPSKLYITDIRKTDIDPLARVLRKWVKDNKIKGKIDVLCSSEVPTKIHDRVPGSTSFVPSGAGLLIASFVIRNIMERK